MNYGLGRITVELAESVAEVGPELVKMINENVSPPVAVTATDVHVRAMHIVSDEVNSYGGRFPAEELPRLAELMIDSPVMVGHRKDRLPIARNFHAKVVSRNGRPWVKSYFYWLREAGGADDLRENIDGGVFKECSVGFTFGLPECSICGKDIRECNHEPLSKTNHKGRGVVCHFNYRRLERVLETSLVYRGAVPNTSMTTDLASTSGGDWFSGRVETAAREISEPGELAGDGSYLMTPAYDGLLVTLEPTETGGQLRMANERILPSAVQKRLISSTVNIDQAVGGILIACRGRERLPVRQLIRTLDDPEAGGHRLELRLFGSPSVPAELLAASGRDRVSLMRHRVVAIDRVDQDSRTMRTRTGVHLWSNHEQPWAGDVYIYRGGHATGVSDSYELTMIGRDTAILSLAAGGHQSHYRVFQFDPRRLMNGGRFVCDRLEQAKVSPHNDVRSRLTGTVERVEEVGQGMVLQLSGSLFGTFALQQIRLDGTLRYMFCRVGPSPINCS